MKNLWFESVAVAQRRAKRRLPRSVYSALVAGSEAGITVADNVAAFGELGFAPHVGGAPAHRDMTTTVMGEEISLPVLISPTVFNRSIPRARWRWRERPPRAARRWA